MLLVIFGAGASYDSNPFAPTGRPGINSNEVDRPPLASQLFGERHNFLAAASIYSFASAALQQLRHATAGRDPRPIETLLRELEEEAASYPPALTELAGVRFYLQTILGSCGDRWLSDLSGHTAYHQIVRDAQKWSLTQGGAVAFVTFNYDLLLEAAVYDVYGHPFQSIDHYVEHEEVRVYKPHGSVNWYRRGVYTGPFEPANAGSDEAKRIVARHVPKLQLSDEFFVYPWNVNIVEGSVTGGIQVRWPAVAVPIEQKAIWESPPTHMDQLKEDLQLVTRVVVIGWRGAEDHFIEFLYGLKHNLPVAVVAENAIAVAETRANLARTGRFGGWCGLDSGFSAVVTANTPARDRFLRFLAAADDQLEITYPPSWPAGMPVAR